MSEIEVLVAEKELRLRADGTLFDPATETLHVADLHLGKDTSFRAAGLPVPQGMTTSILETLSTSIRLLQPKRLLILGDLIHNRASMSDELRNTFSNWREQHPRMKMILVEGNHDRHIAQFPADWGLQVESKLSEESITYVHETTESPAELFQMGGHLHPVVRLSGGVDSLKLRCFLLEEHRLVLPAFGIFKGGCQIRSGVGKSLFPFSDKQIWKYEA